MENAASHRAPPFFDQRFLSSQIQAILYQLSLAMQKNRLWSNQENGLAGRILRFIDDNKGEQMKNQDYTAAFGKSYSRLNAVFQAVYGVTIKQMQGILRIRPGQAHAQLRLHHRRDQRRLRVLRTTSTFLKVFKRKPHDALALPGPVPGRRLFRPERGLMVGKDAEDHVLPTG